MKLTLIQPYFWTLLVLLVSTLQWENVASVPVCPHWDSSCYWTLKNMFDQALNLSYELQYQSTEMLKDFLQDVQYTPGRWYLDMAQSSCHTSTFAILLTKEETEQTEGIILLKEILTMLRAWEDPLNHVVMEESRMEETPTALIARARAVEEAMKGLKEGVSRIISKINPGSREVAEYPKWKGQASLHSTDEDIRVLAFHSLFQCLRRDSQKIDYNLKLLKCRYVYDRDC